MVDLRDAIRKERKERASNCPIMARFNYADLISGYRVDRSNNWIVSRDASQVVGAIFLKPGVQRPCGRTSAAARR
jgi:hypothetical protein